MMSATTSAAPFQPDEAYVRQLDADDPLRSSRDQFLIPQRHDGTPQVYLCGHSLGLQPAAVRSLIEQDLDDWARLGVEGHFHGKTPWYGGGSFAGTFGRIEAGFRCRPDLVAADNPREPREYLGRLYLDSLVHDAEALRGLIRLVGAERIALGTDYPFPLGEQEPGRLIESLTELSPAERERMVAGTAREFLGIQVAT